MLSCLCPPFRGSLTGKDTDTAEDMVPTTERTMEAVAACGNRVRDRLPQVLLRVQAFLPAPARPSLTP